MLIKNSTSNCSYSLTAPSYYEYNNTVDYRNKTLSIIDIQPKNTSGNDILFPNIVYYMMPSNKDFKKNFTKKIDNQKINCYNSTESGNGDEDIVFLSNPQIARFIRMYGTKRKKMGIFTLGI